MKKKSIGAHLSMCVQPTFIIGTYNEDGTPDFAPITWISVTCEKDTDYFIVVSMYGTKKTKQNTMRSKQLSINLASCDMLELVDYFGHTSGKKGIKNALQYKYEKATSVEAPILDLSPWAYECEVAKCVNTGESDTFFCRIKNVQIDETIEFNESGDIDLVAFNPIVYSGQFFSIGKKLGNIGDTYKP